MSLGDGNPSVDSVKGPITDDGYGNGVIAACSQRVL